LKTSVQPFKSPNYKITQLPNPSKSTSLLLEYDIHQKFFVPNVDDIAKRAVASPGEIQIHVAASDLEIANVQLL